MKRVWEKKQKGVFYYLYRIPLVTALALINIVLISWFLHLLFYFLTDTSHPMSLWQWSEHLYLLSSRFISILSDYLT